MDGISSSCDQRIYNHYAIITHPVVEIKLDAGYFVFWERRGVVWPHNAKLCYTGLFIYYCLYIYFLVSILDVLSHWSDHESLGFCPRVAGGVVPLSWDPPLKMGDVLEWRCGTFCGLWIGFQVSVIRQDIKIIVQSWIVDSIAVFSINQSFALDFCLNFI